MQSRRDQVQAQSYVLARLTSALVMAEPETLDNPHRRVVVGTIVGTLIAALIVAGFTVYGFIKPGGATTWRKPGTLVVEKETGTRYLLVDGSLRPVLNYSSAVLLLGGKPPLATVSSASLSAVPRGLPLGIVGAPDHLPAAAGLASARWSICATPAGAALLIDNAAPQNGLSDREALLARLADGRSFLVWQGRRFQLTQEWVAQVFGFAGAAVRVPPAWLDQLPPGPDLGSLPVPGRGEPGPVIDGEAAKIGQVFVAKVPGTGDRHYVLRRDGLSVLSPLALALALGDPATAQVYQPARAEPVPLTASALGQVRLAAEPALPQAVPAEPPQAATPPSKADWCVQRHSHAITTWIAPLAPVQAGLPSAQGFTFTQQTAVAVAVQAGLGGLVRAGRAEQANGQQLFLVTDAGVKFPVPGGEVAKLFGYDAGSATLVAPALLDLLPTGPVLDQAFLNRAGSGK
jgi:type VII secretion protein EccB